MFPQTNTHHLQIKLYHPFLLIMFVIRLNMATLTQNNRPKKRLKHDNDKILIETKMPPLNFELWGIKILIYSRELPRAFRFKLIRYVHAF